MPSRSVRRGSRTGGPRPRVRRPEVRGVALAAAGLVLAAGLGACSGDDDPAAGTAMPPPTEPLWNPCSAISVDQVTRLFGAETTKEDGTDTDPSCSFTPATEGGAALDANYLLYPAGLDRAFDTFGVVEGETTTVLDPEVVLADDARLVVDVRDDTLLLSGFVQNGDLIQTVNLADVAPFRRARAITGMEKVLASLSRAAERAGVGESE